MVFLQYLFRYIPLFKQNVIAYYITKILCMIYYYNAVEYFYSNNFPGQVPPFILKLYIISFFSLNIGIK